MCVRGSIRARVGRRPFAQGAVGAHAGDGVRALERWLSCAKRTMCEHTGDRVRKRKGRCSCAR